MYEIIRGPECAAKYGIALEHLPAFSEKGSNGKEYEYTSVRSYMINFFTLKSIRAQQKKASQYNNLKGSSYEKFIGKRYENKGYHVIYHGLEQKFKDQGIDLIAQKENTIIFIQCKNWVGGKYNKLFRKDLQAFAGDCFLFMQKSNKYNVVFDNKHIALHFIVNKDELLDESAKRFLEQNPFIKFKVVEFTDTLFQNE